MGRERVVDIVVVGLAAMLATTGAVPQLPELREPYDAVAFGLLLVGASSLWFRRRAPVAVAWFVAGLGAAVVMAARVAGEGASLEPESTLLPSAAPFAAYAVTAFARGHRARLSWLPLVVVAAVACLGAPPSSRTIAVVGLAVTLVGGPAVLGRYVATRAERAAREQRLHAEQARRQERLRLAAEIHDVVSHRVSVMVLQAGALHLTAADEPSRQAAEELRATGCQALDELRDLVGLLNATGPADVADRGPLEPLPDLSALVEAAESVGATVDVVTEGVPYPVSPPVGRTAYRVVQEALTNVRKHAPGARVRLRVGYLPTGLRLSVHNTAPAEQADAGTAAEIAATGGGTGLLGLRRRIELIDGTLRAEPHTDGGFLVDARLPSIVLANGTAP